MGNANRKFGLTASAAFGALFLARGWRLGHWSPALIAACVFFGAVTLVRPDSLDRPRRIWIGFGEFIGKFTQPVILGVVYYGVVTPFAVILRKKGKMKFRPTSSSAQWKEGKPSYWTPVEPAGKVAASESFRRQF